MRTIHGILACALCLAVGYAAAPAAATTALLPAACCLIGEIQEYNPSTGAPESPYHNTIVTVSGIAYTSNHWFDRETIYIQDCGAGILVELPGPSWYEAGNRIEVTGRVSTNDRDEIVITEATAHVVNYEPVPDPISATISGLITPPDYEFVGLFTSCFGEVYSVAADHFFLAEIGASGDSIRVVVPDGSNVDIGNVDFGDEYSVTGACVVDQGEIQLMPRAQSDLVESTGGDPAPVITDIEVTSFFTDTSTDITITADIRFGVSGGDTLYYRYAVNDSISTDPFIAVPMSLVTGTTFSGLIPAPHTLDRIDYYIVANDFVNPPQSSPGGAPYVYYSIPIGFNTIYEIQYVDPQEEDQTSLMFGAHVNVTGVVTSGTYGADASSRVGFVIQQEVERVDAFGHDTRWEGIYVEQNDFSTMEYYVGDRVSVAGVVQERFGMTYLDVYEYDDEDGSSGEATLFEAFGVDLPPPVYAAIHVLADATTDDGDQMVMGEAYESVLVRTQPAYVHPINDILFYLRDYQDMAAGEKRGFGDTELLVAQRPGTGYVPVYDDVAIVQGFMEFVASEFYLVPTGPADIVGGLSGQQDDAPAAEALRLTVAPNPANPRTVIRFELKQEALVRLEILDVRGRRIAVLHDGPLPARIHGIPWAGADDAGRGVASGTYFARLISGDGTRLVKELALIR